MSNLTATQPTFLATDTRGGTTWLYVAEHGESFGTPPTGGGRILRFNLTTGSGTPQVVANRGTANGQFISPDGILVDAATGDIFVTDRYQNRVQRLSVNATTGVGTYVMGWGSGTTGAADELRGPVGIARDSAGAIYIAEHGDMNTNAGGNFVSKYTVSGTTATRVWRLANGFNTPYGIAVSGNQLFISDGFNARVQVWDLNGVPATPISIPGTIPLGLSIDTTGTTPRLWVAESSDNGTGATQRVERLTLAGASTSMSFGTNGSANGQFSLPFHAVVSGTRVYVADYGNSRVQVFDLSSTPPPTGSAPAITSQLTASVTAGAAFSYTITASNSPTTFTATNLPAGLTFTSPTISGSVATAGTYNINIGASNASGSDSEVLVLTVNPASTGGGSGPSVASFDFAGSSLAFNITFSESVTGVDISDFQIEGTGNAVAGPGAAVTGSGTTYSVPFTWNGGGPGSIYIRLNPTGTGITGASGAFSGAGKIETHVPVSGTGDATAPTVVSFTPGTPSGNTVVFTLNFDESVWGLDASDITLASGSAAGSTIGAFTYADATGSSYRIPVTYTASTGTIQLVVRGTAAGNIRDGNGNILAANATSTAHTITTTGGGDTTAPTVSSFTIASSTASSVTYQIVFSEAVTGVGAADFTATRGGSTGTATVGTVTAVSGTTYTVPVNFTGSGGSVVLALNASGTGIQDAAGNAIVGGSTAPTHTVGATDTTAPTVSSFTIASSTASSVTYQIVFSETVTGVNAADFAATRAGSTGGTATLGALTAVSGTTYTQVVNFTGSGGTVALALNASGTGIQDAAGNAIVGGATGPTHTVATSGGGDTTAPTVASFTIASSTASSVTYQIVFSEAVTGVNAADFTASRAGSAGSTATVGTVSGTGATYSIPVSFTGTTGSVQLSLNAAGTGIQDAAGNAIVGGSTGPTHTIGSVDATAPTVSSFTIASSAGSTVNYQIVFSETVTGVNAADFTATRAPSGSGTATVGTVSGSGTTYTIPVTYTGNTGTLQLSLNASGTGIQDAAGNAFAAGATGPTVNIDAVAPTATMTIASSTNSSVTYQLVFSETVTGVDAGDFTATRAGSTGGSATLGAFTAVSGTTYQQVVNFTGSGGTVSLRLNAINSGIKDASNNLLGASVTGPTHTVAVSSTIPVVSNHTITGSVSVPITYQVQATNSPTSYSASGMPAGFTLNTTTGVISGAAPAPTLATITVTATNASGSGSGSITFNIGGSTGGGGNTGGGGIIIAPPPVTTPPPAAVKSNQTIVFTAPVSAVLVNQPINLGATASSNLPITYSIVTGNATLSGSTLTIHDTKTVVVRASQHGNENFNAAAAIDVSMTASKNSQSINFAALADALASTGSVTLNATASSGLPVTITVSGPATLSGNTLRLNGTAGVVTVTAAQSGNDAYNPAATVTRTFNVRAVGSQVFFGTMGSDAFAAGVSADGSKGVFITRLGSTGQGIAVKFKVNANGSFSATTTASVPVAEASNGFFVNPTAAAGQTYTVNGTLTNGVLSGTIVELGQNFTANIQPSLGSTASLAGVYTASVPGSASGDTYLVVGPSGQAYALAMLPSGAVSGTGTISTDGKVNITTNNGATIAANIEGSNVSGTVTAAGAVSNIVGLSDGTSRTDRLVNLSSRLRVAAGDASRSVIAGFVVSGTEPKKVLVRAVGPGLSGFGVSGALSNPSLQIYSGSAIVAENNDWSNNADVSAVGDSVGAFKLTANSQDAALVATLQPGAYTAVVQANGGNGVVLVEVYDAETNTQLSAQQMVNISTRGFVDTGDGQLIAGFVVSGNAPKRVLIRGIGPGLTQFGLSGAVADPQLKVYAANGSTLVAQNDDWSTAQPINATQVAATSADVAAAATATGAFPLAAGSKDAAIVITLMPGQYSAVVSGANNSTGAGLVEVYEIPNL